jgi:hypothetical protein
MAGGQKPAGHSSLSQFLVETGFHFFMELLQSQRSSI